MAGYKPEGYTSVAPYLIVEGADQLIALMAEVFGGELLRRFDGEGGLVRHAEVRVGDTVVMVADSAPGWPAATAHVHVYVADVDQAYGRAIAAGAKAVQAPEQRGDEDRRGGFQDASGTTWWVATRVG